MSLHNRRRSKGSLSIAQRAWCRGRVTFHIWVYVGAVSGWSGKMLCLAIASFETQDRLIPPVRPINCTVINTIAADKVRDLERSTFRARQYKGYALACIKYVTLGKKRLFAADTLLICTASRNIVISNQARKERETFPQIGIQGGRCHWLNVILVPG